MKVVQSMTLSRRLTECSGVIGPVKEGLTWTYFLFKYWDHLTIYVRTGLVMTNISTNLRSGRGYESSGNFKLHTSYRRREILLSVANQPPPRGLVFNACSKGDRSHQTMKLGRVRFMRERECNSALVGAVGGATGGAEIGESRFGGSLQIRESSLHRSTQFLQIQDFGNLERV